MSFLYLTDVSEIPPASLDRFKRCNTDIARVIVIGSLRMRPHVTHFCFSEALTAALALGPNTVYLTHICHNHSHREIEYFCYNFKAKRLSSLEDIEIHPAHDGLELSV